MALITHESHRILYHTKTKNNKNTTKPLSTIEEQTHTSATYIYKKQVTYHQMFAFPVHVLNITMFPLLPYSFTMKKIETKTNGQVVYRGGHLFDPRGDHEAGAASGQYFNAWVL